MIDVAVVTCDPLPVDCWDDAILVDALLERGFTAQTVAWNRPFDFRAVRVAVLRSTWNYHHQRDRFLAWAERVSTETSLWNPFPVVRTNTHKSYLRALADKGVPVVPTEWVAQGARATLKGLLATRGWKDAVVKPAVSAGANDTFRVRSEAEVRRVQPELERIAARTEVMIQPYLPSVENEGERSLIFIDGQFTHAVRKRPMLASEAGRAPGLDGTDAHLDGYERVDPDPSFRATAERVLAAVEGELLYARVDLARGADGQPLLMELELTEPSLFLPQSPEAAWRLADAIGAKVQAAGRR